MTPPLRIWITTPSRTASTFLKMNLEANLVCEEMHHTHDNHAAPADPRQWHCIINTRLDAHAGAVSTLIWRRRRDGLGPGHATVEEYLGCLSSHYNYALTMRPLPWRTVRHWHMEHITAASWPWRSRIDPEWPCRHRGWRAVPQANAGPNHGEWIHNLAQLAEIGACVAREGHYQGYQIVKDPQDPRYSDQRRPGIRW